MKKEKNILDYLDTALLLMILTAQVIHTTGLYMTYTRLSGTKAELVGNFISITIELLVYRFVYRGNAAAGAWFAILLFFAGELYNDNWEGSRIDISLYPFQIRELYLPLPFISSTLMQFLSSLSIWYLSDMHAKKKKEQDITESIQELNKQEQEANSRIQELNRKIQDKKDLIQALQKEEQSAVDSLLGLNQTKTKMGDILNDLEQKCTEKRNEIISLNRAKAGSSKRSTQSKQA